MLLPVDWQNRAPISTLLAARGRNVALASLAALAGTVFVQSLELRVQSIKEASGVSQPT